MPKKKRFRSRVHGDDLGGGSGGSRPRSRRPRRRRGPGYQDAFAREEDGQGGEQGSGEPELDEEGNPIPRAESQAAPQEEPGEEFYGMLEMHPNGYGFLRSPSNNYSRERSDPFVPGTMIEKFKLRQGLKIRAVMQQSRRSQGPRVREIVDVEGLKPEDYLNVKTFDSLTPVNPDKWLRLEVGAQPITNRVIDLLAPLGRGQRALKIGRAHV